MKKEFPFPNFKTHYCLTVPDPDVRFIEVDQDSGAEVVKILPASAYILDHPLVKDKVSLQDLLDSGIPIKELKTQIYESSDETDYPFTQDDLYEKVKEIVDNYNKEEK